MTLIIQVLALVQAQKCGGIKLVDGIPTLPSWYLDLLQQYIYKQTLKNLDRFASCVTQKDHILLQKLMST